jgi:hypothetical protein
MFEMSRPNRPPPMQAKPQTTNGRLAMLREGAERGSAVVSEFARSMREGNDILRAVARAKGIESHCCARNERPTSSRRKEGRKGGEAGAWAFGEGRREDERGGRRGAPSGALGLPSFNRSLAGPRAVFARGELEKRERERPCASKACGRDLVGPTAGKGGRPAVDTLEPNKATNGNSAQA